jgi:hypothetical protein
MLIQMNLMINQKNYYLSIYIIIITIIIIIIIIFPIHSLN